MSSWTLPLANSVVEGLAGYQGLPGPTSTYRAPTGHLPGTYRAVTEELPSGYRAPTEWLPTMEVWSPGFSRSGFGSRWSSHDLTAGAGEFDKGLDKGFDKGSDL